MRNPYPDVKSKLCPLHSHPRNQSQRDKAYRYSTLAIKTLFKIEWIINLRGVALGTSGGIQMMNELSLKAVS